MSPNKKRQPPSLSRLLDELADDLASLTDAELRAEAEADDVDLEAEAQKVRSVIAFAIAREGKKKLAAARAAVDRETKARVVRQPLRVRDRAKVLARFTEQDGKSKIRLTMAARNGGGINAEADSILEDLRELGAIDDEGNPV